jgi:hypothetical protein
MVEEDAKRETNMEEDVRRGRWLLGLLFCPDALLRNVG